MTTSTSEEQNSSVVVGLDMDALASHPTRLKATAAAFALLVAGEQPSLSRVAELVGSSRQNLYKSHKPVVELIERLRAEWTPREDGPTADLIRDRDEALAEAARERRKRKQVEEERDRLMHHLELSDATVHALSRPGGAVTRMRR